MNKPSARKVLDFTLISNPLVPSNKARHAMRKAIKTVRQLPRTDFLTRYLCATEHVAEEQILLGHGASHLFSLMLRALHPRSILLPMPAPRAYEEILEKEGVQIRPFALDLEQSFAIDGEAFKERWRDVDAALILNPHNPTGATLPQAVITDLIQTSSERDKLLIIDETLRDFTDNPSLAQRAAATPNAFVLRSFSTYHALAGLRLGYIIGDDDILSHLEHNMEPRSVNSIALPAALASLKDKGYRARTARYLSDEKEYALKKLQAIDRAKPVVTPWGIFIRIEPSASDIKSRFTDERILIDEYKDAQGNQYLSFPFRSRADNARFFRTLRWLLRGQS